MYMNFTQEQKEKASRTDIASFLQSQGQEVKREGSEYVWKDGSAKVSIRENLWYHQYDQEGGNAIDFVRRFYDKSFPEAVKYLLGESEGRIITTPPLEKQKEQGVFLLPKKNENNHRAYGYLLHKRGIDKDVLNTFFYKKMIYESEKYHNVVFVGYDKTGTPRHAHMRGTGSKSTFKGNAAYGTPEYSFHWTGTDEKLYLFEAPIDMLSFISMNKYDWQKHSYAACCGVGERVLFQMLKDNLHLEKVSLCLDNDEAGQKASRRIADKLFLRDIEKEILIPTHKDWNEDLLNPQTDAESMEEKTCQVLQC